jgi:VIT1/CCC1 family predicted Fe2+/Mn2+ transporter
MKQRQLTNWEAAKIGLLLSAGVAFLFLIFWPASRGFTIFGTNAVIVVLAFGIAGALLGRLHSKTAKGAWIGATITIFVLFWWLYRIASNVPLD